MSATEEIYDQTRDLSQYIPRPVDLSRGSLFYTWILLIVTSISVVGFLIVLYKGYCYPGYIRGYSELPNSDRKWNNTQEEDLDHSERMKRRYTLLKYVFGGCSLILIGILIYIMYRNSLSGKTTANGENIGFPIRGAECKSHSVPHHLRRRSLDFSPISLENYSNGGYKGIYLTEDTLFIFISSLIGNPIKIPITKKMLEELEKNINTLAFTELIRKHPIYTKI